MRELPAALAALTTDQARLGLRTGKVELVEHNPLWAALAEDVANHLRSALGDIEVEHVGSTSVPDLAAKPLLDLAVGIDDDSQAEVIVSKLEAAGFTFQMDLGMYGGLLFTVEANPATVVAHIHVVPTNDFQWTWYRAFRDGLRADDTLRLKYETLKRAAAVEHAENRDGYTQAKFEWVRATVSSLSDEQPAESPD